MGKPVLDHLDDLDVGIIKPRPALGIGADMRNRFIPKLIWQWQLAPNAAKRRFRRPFRTEGLWGRGTRHWVPG